MSTFDILDSLIGFTPATDGEEEEKENDQLTNQDNNNSINPVDSKGIDEIALKSKINGQDFIDYVIKVIKKTVKCEDILIKQILCTCLSTYIQDDPINLGIIAPTSEGKTYPVEECIKIFPREDVYNIGSISPKALIRQKGILVDENNEPIALRLAELYGQKRSVKDSPEEERIDEQIKELKENTKTLIDLSGKILVFLEPPQRELWDILKPILSHDSPEIEFDFVDKNESKGIHTKKVIVRGWPSCIFCSTKDESKWSGWSEIKSRFLISSPNMVTQKYQESSKLIASRKGLPKSIQQQIIISETEIDLAKDCISLIKQKINELRENNKKISVWIPYYKLLQQELPSNKGPDVRFIKRIFSLLNVVPIIRTDLRKRLVMDNEISVIADLDDLREILSITQNFDGIPKYKVYFFNNIFYPLYKSKLEPDISKDGQKKEERVSVTAKQLCNFFKANTGKSITTDSMKKTYLDELVNNGLIDHEPSKIDLRQYIYYPLVEPTTNQGENISLISNSDQLDNLFQFTSPLYEKITQKVTEEWLFYEIMDLLRYRIDFGKIKGPLADYLNNLQEFEILDNGSSISSDKRLTDADYNDVPKGRIVTDSNTNSNDLLTNDQLEDGQQQCCYHDIYENKTKSRLTFRQFTKNYVIGFDISKRRIKADFTRIIGGNSYFTNDIHSNDDKTSKMMSKWPEFDNKDIFTTNFAYKPPIENPDNLKYNTKNEPNESMFGCYYCMDFLPTVDQNIYEKHVVLNHVGQLAYPSLADIERKNLAPQGKSWEI